MTMKRFLTLGLALFVSASVLVGCGADEKEPASTDTENKTEESSFEVGNYEDGTYFAQEDGFGDSGWKYVVTLKVEDEKIVEAEWNGAHKDGGTDKITRSESGEYGMVENGEAQASWAEQANLAEEYLLETQDPTDIEYTDDEGHTDAISGVSIHVVEFFDLVEKALENGPVEEGKYKDGNYKAEKEKFEDGWKNTANLTVINGYIVAADWDGIAEEPTEDEDGNEMTKDQVSEAGEYGMVENGGAQASWVEQANLAEDYLLETQDPTDIEYTDDEGHTDAISGVSIHVVEFFELAEKALEEAEK